MTNTSALAEKNRRIKELETEVAYLKQGYHLRGRRMLEENKRAEDAEAHVAKAEAASRRTSDHNVRLLREIVELEMENVTLRDSRLSDPLLAATLRDYRDKIARADRLAEAVAGFDKAAGPFSYLKHALDAYRSDSPPQSKAANGCGSYIGGYCGDDGQLCGACVFDAAQEGEREES